MPIFVRINVNKLSLPLHPALAFALVRRRPVRPAAARMPTYSIGSGTSSWIHCTDIQRRRTSMAGTRSRRMTRAAWRACRPPQKDRPESRPLARRPLANSGVSKTAKSSTMAKGPYLTSDKDYGDFELLIEYRTVARADSGIYLKATPQVQIWDYTDEKKVRYRIRQRIRRALEQQRRRRRQRPARVGR